ncbi:MAG: hypothetical protein IKP07_04940 [Bacilli bacterium]|nr:hypothetical protein [Bacilli bacterium]
MILLLGKNGSGKTYITRELEQKGIKRSVSYTTRPQRPKEVNGEDYVFVDHLEFERMIEAGELIEYKSFLGNYYGTPKKNMETSDIILSGGQISPEILPYIDTVYFIDSPLSLRYNGMLVRKSSKVEMFDRIHGENDEYLFDHKAKIFINTHQDDIVDTIYQSIRDKDLVKARQFRDFLGYAVERYNPQEHASESRLLQFLNYEEYILRKMYLEGKLTREEYEEKVERYLRNNGFFYMPQEDHFVVDFDGDLTYVKKLVKTDGKK